MSIDAAVADKLMAVLGHERVYPDGRFFPRDADGTPEPLGGQTALIYRQTGGSGSKCLDGARGSLRDDNFLLEVFADDRDDCSTVRDTLLDEFVGPLDVNAVGGWETWGNVYGQTCKVHWAELDEPEGGAEFPESDLHMMFRFVRMVLQVQWQKE